MTEHCAFKIHPDGYNGELPHLHEYARWKPCGEPAVEVLRHPWSAHGIPACERHARLMREAQK